MRKNNFYRIPLNKHLKSRIIITIIMIIVIWFLITILPHFFRNTYVVTIASKQIKNQNTKDIKYIIYTQMEDGTIKAFKNDNSILEFKFNSEDIYRGLMIRRKYEIKTYGFRIIPLASYENITTVKRIN
ncbi:DUF1523 family protein [Clostridium sp.]|jgi:hypothetical protein|uniref:DUF1523 family protein n=1 Tax=Clostridium sp. TaxID=1506 RepID=UPI002FDC9286